MSGLTAGQMVPADISVVARRFERGHGGGVKKTSSVTVNRPLGGDLKLGLFIRKNPAQTVTLDFRDATSGNLLGHGRDVTGEPEWRGALAALGQFMDPGDDNQWVLFELPALNVEFTSEFTLSPGPTRPRYQNVPVVAIHVEPNDDERRVSARIRVGAYGYCVSVLRAPDEDWTAPTPQEPYR